MGRKRIEVRLRENFKIKNEDERKKLLEDIVFKIIKNKEENESN